MKQFTRTIVLLLACTLLVAGVQAVSMSIEVSQHTYGPGDTVLISAAFTSTENVRVDAIIDCLITGRKESAIPVFTSRSLTIPPGGGERVTVYQEEVSATTLSDEYTAVCTLNVDGIVEDRKDATFIIEGTLDEFSYTPLLCQDSECSRESLTFLQGDMVYIRYFSSISGISVRGSLTSPDGKARQIVLPAEVRADQTGTYTLALSASKQGYKEMSTRTQFAVLKEEPNIVAGQPRVTAPPPAAPSPTPTEASGCTGLIALLALLIICMHKRL